MTSRPFAAITPNWYAAVMGTGIVAVAAAGLPAQIPGLRTFAAVMWAFASVLLVVVTVATVMHWRLHPAAARGHAHDPVMAHFYGAPPMALLTVGAGALLVGRDWIGLQAALALDRLLWIAGTGIGLATAVAVPYLVFTTYPVREDAAFGGWLMPVVPPMVSASTGALLLAHTPAGQPRLTLLVCCYAMFGLSLIASMMVIAQIWQRLTRYQVGPARMVPTLWIVLGPLGQSITASSLLGAGAHLVVPARYATVLQAAGLCYGLAVWGFAMLWVALAAAITIRTAKEHLPFSLTWWSFTFPVGTVVTGTSALALHTGAGLFEAAAIVLFVGLVVAWAIVAVRTAHGALVTGQLLLPAPAQTLSGQPSDPVERELVELDRSFLMQPVARALPADRVARQVAGSPGRLRSSTRGPSADFQRGCDIASRSTSPTRRSSRT